MAKPPNEEFLKQYIDFCRSPLRAEHEVVSDLHRLLALPMVKTIGFADDGKIYKTLLIGLKPLVITDPATNRRHYIGRFVVYLTRYRDYPVWHADFRLVNIDPVTCDDRVYFHPHMTTDPDEEIGIVAYICIQAGRQPIFQYIRKGQLDLAMELIINLLHTLGPNLPFHDISLWPRARFWRMRK